MKKWIAPIHECSFQIVQFLSGSGGGGNSGQTRTITFFNRCTYPIWINPFPSNNGPQLTNGIPRMEPNARLTLNIPDSGWAGRFWPKTECDGNGQNCAVGQSVAPCPSNGCQPPADTKVEFFYPPKNDPNAVWYDISLVDGYSLPMEIIPSQQVIVLGYADIFKIPNLFL